MNSKPESNVALFPGTTSIEKPLARQPHPFIIEWLENTLERARTGEVQELAATWIDDDGRIVANHFHGRIGCCGSLIGAVRLLEQEIIDCVSDRAMQVPWKEPG